MMGAALRGRTAIAIMLLSFALLAALAGACATTVPAWADEAEEAQKAVGEAQAALDDAERRMQRIADDSDAIKRDVDELQARIDDTAAQAMDAQQALVAGRAALGKVAESRYRAGGAAQSLIALVLEAQDFSELARNLAYLDAVMRRHAEEVEAQKERSARYDELISDLNFQKDEQEKKLGELERKRVEAEGVLTDAASRLQSAKSDEAARLEALRKQAEELAAREAAAEADIVEEATTIDRESVVEPDAKPEPNPDPEPPSPSPSPRPESGTAPGPAPDAAPGPGASWSTGTASAYGGSTDPNTPNPGVTATGAVCDDDSLGVAIPTAWPNYRSYLGRTVEISYGGMTVLATVNDTGSMGGGSRALDLQPGVWKALGATSCLDWGVRTVSYRFL